MNTYKAPGPDGFHAVFFQQSWRVTRPAITSLALNVLKESEIPKGFVDALFVLIPKKQSPDKIEKFWPISLCNVIYKLVTKVIAN